MNVHFSHGVILFSWRARPVSREELIEKAACGWLRGCLEKV